jgi:hypothetical protein
MSVYRKKTQETVKNISRGIKKTAFETSKNKEMWEKLKNKWRNG